MSPRAQRPLAILGARIVDPASGFDATADLLVREGMIAGFGPNLFDAGPPEDAERVDAQGLVLAPGLVDMRVFTGEPGAEHRETLQTASEAAAAGGVTTIVVMPDTDPVIDEAALVDFTMRRARDTAIVNVHPMAALTKGLEGRMMTEMSLLAEAGAVAFTDGAHSVRDAKVMRLALSYAATFDFLIAHFAEDADLAKDGAMNESELSARLGLKGIPDAAETIIVERDLRLVELTGARYHLAQISAAASLDPIARAKAKGLPVTCAVSAHHLALNENDIATYRTFFKTAPPLRGEADRQALVAALREGIIDIVVSNHDPQGPEDKRLPFDEAAPGAVGLETLLPVMLELVHNDAVGLGDALAAVTCRPADLLRLNAGRIAQGAPADLVLFDAGAPFVLDAQGLRSKTKNTPFDGRRLQGRVQRTVVGGRTVYENGTGHA